ncbi:MAG: class I SAM-dependent methyltransferase [Chloroflexi bacterium]|nr:class I SAM-dependent methyltransferase [Chloroflexota bacterium]
MFRREQRHWWYAGMRRAALAVLDRALDGQMPVDLLDAGCGTGGTTVALERFGRVTGVDIAEAALSCANQRELRGQLARASIQELPFPSAGFDVVTSFEVLYHLGVMDDRRALAELHRVLRPRGLLLLRVPAHDWLRGKHDRLVHTRHRYGRGELRDKLGAAGFHVEQLSWANTLLFPPAVGKRVLERLQPGAHDTAANAEPDLWLPPPLLNALLENLVAFEAVTLPRRLPAPFGLSLIALARAV